MHSDVLTDGQESDSGCGAGIGGRRVRLRDAYRLAQRIEALIFVWPCRQDMTFMASCPSCVSRSKTEEGVAALGRNLVYGDVTRMGLKAHPVIAAPAPTSARAQTLCESHGERPKDTSTWTRLQPLGRMPGHGARRSRLCRGRVRPLP